MKCLYVISLFIGLNYSLPGHAFNLKSCPYQSQNSRVLVCKKVQGLVYVLEDFEKEYKKNSAITFSVFKEPSILIFRKSHLGSELLSLNKKEKTLLKDINQDGNIDFAFRLFNQTSGLLYIFYRDKKIFKSLPAYSYYEKKLEKHPYFVTSAFQDVILSENKIVIHYGKNKLKTYQNIKGKFFLKKL